MEEYLVVGKIIDTFSLDGSLKVISSTTNKDIRYKKGNKLFISKNRERKEVEIDSYRRSGNVDILHFVEITNVDEAQAFKGADLLTIKDNNDLKEGYYFYSDLIGCKIVCVKGEIGVVKQVEEFPAQVTLRCKSNDGKVFFVPFVKSFIKKVDIQNKEIQINYMEGLL